MKLIDRPGPVVIGPHDFVTLRTTIKVTATDNGLIFGNISYDVKVDKALCYSRLYLSALFH